jgi:F420H(2)-dependent biliverdin reductase
MAFDPHDLPPAVARFLFDRHLATFTVLAGGALHTTPVGFSWDPDAAIARVITWSGSVKVKRMEAEGEPVPVTLCQLDGGRWLTLEGVASVTGDPQRCADAVARYTERYQAPRRDRGPDRRAIEVQVARILGRA